MSDAFFADFALNSCCIRTRFSPLQTPENRHLFHDLRYQHGASIVTAKTFSCHFGGAYLEFRERRNHKMIDKG